MSHNASLVEQLIMAQRDLAIFAQLIDVLGLPANANGGVRAYAPAQIVEAVKELHEDRDSLSRAFADLNEGCVALEKELVACKRTIAELRADIGYLRPDR
jgi:hypothetical protein